MRSILIVYCLISLLQMPRMAGAASFDGLRFTPIDFNRCIGTEGGDADRTFTLVQLAPRRHYCLLAQFDMARQPTQMQVLVFSAMASTEFFLDGVLVGSNGTPSDTEAGEREGLIDYWITLTPQQLAQGRHTLLLKVSTWHASAQVRTLFTNCPCRTSRRCAPAPSPACRRCCWRVRSRWRRSCSLA